MNPIIQEQGEITLLCEDTRVTSLNSLEEWQAEELVETNQKDTSQVSSACLKNIDKIIDQWLESLNDGEWERIRTQKSLYGITIPQDWIKVWRFILKEPNLRDSDTAAKRGRYLSSYTYIWNIWAEECIDMYLDDMDKRLLAMVDAGYPYAEIGQIMLGEYGEAFWKPRKKNTKTTPSQVVNNYLYLKLPTKIARQELYDIAKIELKKRHKKRTPAD